MKGLRLHTRPATESDHDALERLLAGDYRPPASREVDFIAKLIGDPVAFARTRRLDDTLILEQLYVIPTLRHKRIGTVFLSEIGAWAVSNHFRRLQSDTEALPHDFLLRTGFEVKDQSFLKSLS
jgi:hypothetical protein